MKKIVLILFILLSNAAMAQDSLTNSSIEKATFLTTKLAEELSLNEKQHQKLFKVLLKRSEEIATLNNSIDIIAFQERIEGINLRFTNDLNKIVSANQFSEYLKLKNQKKEMKNKYKKDHPEFLYTKEDIELDL